MKNHITKYKHHYLRLGLMFCLLLVVYLLTITIKQHDSSYAITYDSRAIILVTGDYQGSTSATSSQHSFGTCSSAPGQLFTIQAGTYTSCDGVAFGSPDGLAVYVPTAPSGFYVANWRVTGNTTDGGVSCSASQCVLNYTTGTANLEVDINAITRPTAPTISVGGTTANSVAFNWTAGSAGSATFYNYMPYYNGSSNGATQAMSFNWTGLSCGRTVSMSVAIRTSAGNYNSNTVSGTTTACSTPPPPSPPPTPTPTPTPPPTPIQGGSTSPPVIQSPGAPRLLGSPILNDVPPSTPNNFQALASGTSSAVSLSWDNSVTVLSYMLERSTDNITWKMLDAEIIDNSYVDNAADFDTDFYYRLTAVDDKNRKSEPAVAKVHTSTFHSNSGNGKDLRLKSPDGVLELFIPARALLIPASCSFASQPSLPLYGIAKYEEVYRPYQLICQQQDNALVSSFAVPLDATLTFSSKVSKKYAKYALAGFDASDSSWHSISVADTEKPPVIKFKLAGSYTGLAVHGQPKHASILVVALGVLGGIIVAVGLLALVLRKVVQVRAVRRVKAINDDYWRKTNGV